MNFWKYLCSQSCITDTNTHGYTYLLEQFFLKKESKLFIIHSFVFWYSCNISPGLINTKPLNSITPLRKIMVHTVTGLPVETHIRGQEYKLLLWYKSLCLPDRSTNFDAILPSSVVTSNDYISSHTDTLVSEFWITHDLTTCIKAITVYMSKELLWYIEVHRWILFLVFSYNTYYHPKNLELLPGMEIRVLWIPSMEIITFVVFLEIFQSKLTVDLCYNNIIYLGIHPLIHYDDISCMDTCLNHAITWYFDHNGTLRMWNEVCININIVSILFVSGGWKSCLYWFIYFLSKETLLRHEWILIFPEVPSFYQTAEEVGDTPFGTKTKKFTYLLKVWELFVLTEILSKGCYVL